MIRFLFLVTFVACVALGNARAEEQQALLPSAEPIAKARAAVTLVVLSAPDTPQQLGYVKTALAAAETARVRLSVAMARQDAADFHRQLAGALHALDPRFGAADGEADYGLRPALAKAAENMGKVGPLAAKDVQVPVLAAALTSAQSRVDEAVDFGRAALVTPSPEVARQAGKAMAVALDRAVEGWDRDGDGNIEWQHGEAGLRQAEAAANRVAGGVAAQ